MVTIRLARAFNALATRSALLLTARRRAARRTFLLFAFAVALVDFA